MRHAALALLLALFPLDGCAPPVDTSKDRVPEWATGGTLHDVTLDVWATGTDENKLATAGELLYDSLWQGHLVTDEQIEAFGAKVAQLVMMTDDLARLTTRISQYDPEMPNNTIRSLLAEGMNDPDEFVAIMGPASMQDQRTPAP